MNVFSFVFISLAPPTLSVPDQVYIQPYLVSSVSLSGDCSFLAIGQCPGLLSLFDLTATSEPLLSCEHLFVYLSPLFLLSSSSW